MRHASNISNRLGRPFKQGKRTGEKEREEMRREKGLHVLALERVDSIRTLNTFSAAVKPTRYDITKGQGAKAQSKQYGSEG
jgi:hypothetical protein